MLYMVVEHYRNGLQAVYDRAAQKERMLPEGLVYIESWADERDLSRCYQLMETDDPSLFAPWIAAWADLVEFDVVPVIRSADAARRAEATG